MSRIKGIKGLTDGPVRLPRAGVIRLGEKKVGKSGAEYPSKTSYFNLEDAPLVAELYGEQPTELDIVFPTNDVDAVFDVAYVAYGKSGWKCRGNGVEAYDREAGESIKCLGEECPRYGKECKRLARLQFVLYKVPGSLGVYTISTGSVNSILNIQGALEMLQGITSGNIAWIPLKLVMDEAEVSYKDDSGKLHTTTIYPIRIDLPASIMDIAKIRIGGGQIGGELPASPEMALPAPEEAPLPDDLYPKSVQEEEEPEEEPEVIEPEDEEPELLEPEPEDEPEDDEDLFGSIGKAFDQLGIPPQSKERADYLKRYKNTPDKLLERLNAEIKTKKRKSSKPKADVEF